MAPALSDILRITSSLLILILLTFCMGATNLEAKVLRLANDEVEALLEVATQLGKKGWNRNMNLCDDEEVFCNCSFPGGVCHVDSIYLNGQDLDGSLPKAIQKLPHLKELNLWANYLSGNIPPEWADTKLETLYLDVNRLTGKIPSYLGKITTLTSLSIENNMFYGTVPPELGDLVNLESLYLSANNLSGELPSALANLIRLKTLSIENNMFYGTVPPELGGLVNLESLTLSANNLSGELPSALANLIRLKTLSIENNMFSGTVPPELGDLVNLESLTLSANNLSGELPLALANLTGLKTLRLSSNNFTGRIPEFIQSWKQLDALEIEAGGFTGPIPSSISLLTSLTELRISNLLGNGSEIPNLDPIANITYLMLSNCNLSGKFPEYLTNKSQLQILDLSFNRLSGPLPPSFEGLQHMQNMYLTWNNFTGPFPQWINTRDPLIEIDLSYNNFTSEAKCKESLNLFKSTWGWNYSKPVECLGACSAERYSVHINCGGPAATIGNTTYEADNEKGGAAKYEYTREDWQKSTTGHFWDTSDTYVAQNMSILRMNNSVLYTEASLTPLSLTYYIPCLVNGNYNVKLHFAEIVIRGNRSYYSLGRRVFDVYIQNIVVLKDFNIVTKAGGVDKVYIHNYTALVTNGALEIRLHWAGKGTTWSPEIGTYGPLISAIDVESDFAPPNNGRRKRFIIAGAVVLLLFLIFILLSSLWWKGYLGGRKSRDRELVGLDLVTGIFTFRQIKTATNDFDAANKLGEGGFGCVYKGVLSDGTQIAVKQLSAKSKQGNREFVNEIGMISALQHPNLVRLYGCCIEGKQLLLVYEYMVNNSLAHVLFGTKEIEATKLDWHTRQRICVNIAKGLVFLHEESTLKIVHRDIKGTNILLDKDMNAKISDFGMAKLDDEDNTHIDTRIAGTMGYMAPEYALYGYLTYKADVYSFGVVALEIVSGMNNAKFRRGENFVCLLDWVLYLQKNGDIMEMVDPRLGSAFNKKEVVRMINVALLCTNQSPTLRPIMSTVVSMLEGKTNVEELVMVPSTLSDQSGYATASFNKFAQASFSGSSSETKSLVKSSEVPWTASSSSSSAQDLYPVHIE